MARAELVRFFLCLELSRSESYGAVFQPLCFRLKRARHQPGRRLFIRITPPVPRAKLHHGLTGR
jgi:hypothetical protein